jgi:hypothetical protein
MAADALQIFGFPLFAEGALSPADDVLDLAVAAALVNLLGCPVRRDAIVDGLDVGADLNARRIGSIAVVAQEEHEWLTEPGLDHATVRRAVDVDACLAPGILVAELQGDGPTEGVTEYSHARHVEPSSEPGRIRRVQPSEAIEHERDIAGHAVRTLLTHRSI